MKVLRWILVSMLVAGAVVLGLNGTVWLALVSAFCGGWILNEVICLNMDDAIQAECDRLMEYTNQVIAHNIKLQQQIRKLRENRDNPSFSEDPDWWKKQQ